MQKSEPDRPIYPFSPISSRKALARMLQCSIDDLLNVGMSADFRYRSVKILKKDGTIRDCYDAKHGLKAMQARIKCLILKKVIYPPYLMGGIADHASPRDYVRNAQRHSGARVMVNEDIAQFFPSITRQVVFDIWRYFFHCPCDVASTLTQLTTLEGVLPQGAKTSSYLANLAFWSTEPGLVARLHSLGFQYTRYIDDITISSKADKSKEELFAIFEMLTAMVKRGGLRLKRSKHRLVYSGNRMEVTGLIVSERSAGLGHKRRSGVRALVHQCEVGARIDPDSPVLCAMKRRAASLAGQYARLHPAQGTRLQRHLKSLPK